MAAIEVLSCAIDSPIASSMMNSLKVEIDTMYPEPGEKHIDLTEKDVAGGAFLVAYLSDVPVGCVALRKVSIPELDLSCAHMQRLFVQPTHRGMGISSKLLEATESRAKELGMKYLVLQTGLRQKAAVALYENRGFTRRNVFGEYMQMDLGDLEEFTVYYQKALV